MNGFHLVLFLIKSNKNEIVDSVIHETLRATLKFVSLIY